MCNSDEGSMQLKHYSYEGCDHPFEEVDELGCVSVSPMNETKTWHDARQVCRALGADLYVVHGRRNFEAVLQYLENKIGIS